MKTMNIAEMQNTNAGYTVYCPVCGYKSRTFWLRDLFYGKRASIAYEETWLQARHFRASRGYIWGKKAHK